MAQALPPGFRILEKPASSPSSPPPAPVQPATAPGRLRIAEPAAEPPPTQAASLWELLTRLPNVTAGGAMKGVANLIDLPIDLANAIVQAAAAPAGGTSFKLPGTAGAKQAVQAYGESTGGFPTPQTGTERVASRVGEEVLPAAALATTGLSMAPKLPGLARNLMTSGAFGTDLTMATGAGAGAGLAREWAPGSPTAELAGQVGGGVASALPRVLGQDVLLGGLLKLLGVGPLTESQQGLKQSFANTGIDPLASDLTGRTGVARIEAVPQQFPIGIQPAQEFAERQMGQASGAVERTVPGSTTETPDLLGSGLAAQRSMEPVTSAREAADISARQAAERTGRERLGVTTAPDMTTAGQRAQTNINATYRQWQARKGPLFEEIERMAGDEPVVMPDDLRGIAGEISTRASETGLGSARGTSTLKDIGVTPPPDVSKVTVGGMPLGEVEGPMRDIILRELGIDLTEDAGPITFQRARHIQSRLGEAAFQGRAIGTLNQGDARRMYGAISRDLDRFITDPNTDPRLGPALAEAKQEYATNRALFNESVNQQVLGKGANAQGFLDRVFAPGKIENTLDFKQAVDDRTYQQSVAAKLASLFDTAVDADGNFLPKKFVSAAQKYLHGGEGRAHIDTILEPEAATRFRAMVDEFTQVGTTKIPDIEQIVTGSKPEEIVSKVFRPGGMSDTVAFRSAAAPEVFDQSVQTWAQQLYRNSVTTKGGQTAGEEVIAPSKFVRQVKPLLDSGQLDVMFADRPEVVGQFKELVEVFQRLGRAETLAGNPSGTGQTILGFGQISALLRGATQLVAGLGASYGAGGGVTGAVAGIGTALAPYALGKFTRSATGRRVLSEGVTGPLERYSGPAARFALRILGQQVSDEEGKPGLTLDLEQLPNPRSLLPKESPPTLAISGIRG